MEEKSAEFVQILWGRTRLATLWLPGACSGCRSEGGQISQRH